ncbi:hypothetical protein B0H11DRAFT_1901594 [Mycena galericulata]|nr:hypothetical protein B0H11DRAFT_1901594 [Mycena galericulata]
MYPILTHPPVTKACSPSHGAHGDLADNPKAVARLWDRYQTLEENATPQPSYSRGSLALPGRRERRRRPSSRDAPVVRRASGATPPFHRATRSMCCSQKFVLGSVFADVVNSGIKTLHLYVTYSAAYYGDDDQSAGPSSTWAWILRGRRVPPPESAVPRHARQPRLPIRPTPRAPPASPSAPAPPSPSSSEPTSSRTCTSMRISTPPYKFVPGRYDPEREEGKSAPLAYLAWGAGRHPCARMKVAKLGMKIVLALFLLGFEYEVVDTAERPLDALPQIDGKDVHLARSRAASNQSGRRCQKRVERRRKSFKHIVYLATRPVAMY